MEENTCAYPCGHAVVLYNSETREQELIHGMAGPGGQGSDGITALGLTPNRKYLAVAEKRDAGGVVNVFDASTRRRRKMLSYGDLGSKEIVSVNFSGDGKFCLTQGGAPDWTLVLWTFDRAAKPIATTRTSAPGAGAVRRADFCPQDATVVCATGRRAARRVGSRRYDAESPRAGESGRWRASG